MPAADTTTNMRLELPDDHCSGRTVASTRRPSGFVRADAPIADAVVQCAVLVGWFVAYLLLRGAVEGTHQTATRNASEVMRIEAMLGIDLERPLNERVAQGPHQLAAIASFIYKWGYWMLVITALVLCWLRSRHRWYVVLRNGLLASTVVGLIIFWSLPVAPPRAMPGFVDLVNGAKVHLGQRPPGGTNVYAAMPSFHAGWSVAAATIAGWTMSSTVARRALWLAGAIMTPVVIVTANHYVLDVLVGIAITVFCVIAAQRRHLRQVLAGGITATTTRPPRRTPTSTGSAPA